jgi:hypothetical protein
MLTPRDKFIIVSFKILANDHDEFRDWDADED